MAEETKKKTTSKTAAPKKATTAKKAAAPKAAPKAEAVKEEPVKEVKAEKATKPVAAKKEAKVETKVEKPKVTSALAIATNVRVTPRKVRLIADYVRGKKVADALAILKKVNKVGCTPLEKIIRSAAANATNNFGMNEDLLYVAELQVSDGMKIKRYLPRAKGSASGLVKRNANIRCIVKEKKEGDK